MRKIHIEHIQEAYKLGKPVYTTDGNVLLAEGSILTSGLANKLISYGIYEVYINDDISENIKIDNVICDQTRNEAKVTMKKVIQQYKDSGLLESFVTFEIVDKVLDQILNSKEIVYNLTEIKTVDDYTFSHSVDVCVLSLLLGCGIGIVGEQLRELGVGALLHDIGKLKVAESILKKPSQLSSEEFEGIKKHTTFGYEILSKSKSVSKVSALIALTHHERIDGSGYPFQLHKENIHTYAKIVAVADVYDALTSDRIYRKKLKPHEVFEYVIVQGGRLFDRQVIESFSKSVSVYPIGTMVKLNTGYTAIVANVTKLAPGRPKLRVVLDCEGKKLVKPFDINLAENNEYCIIDSFDV